MTILLRVNCFDQWKQINGLHLVIWRRILRRYNIQKKQLGNLNRMQTTMKYWVYYNGPHFQASNLGSQLNKSLKNPQTNVAMFLTWQKRLLHAFIICWILFLLIFTSPRADFSFFIWSLWSWSCAEIYRFRLSFFSSKTVSKNLLLTSVC